MREWIEGRLTRGKVLFTGTRRRMTSVTVRGDQMAEEMGGVCLRNRFLTGAAVQTSPAAIWIVEADLDQVARFRAASPQIMDVINPAYEQDRDKFAPQYRTFRYMLLNTRSSRHYLGVEPDHGWRTWVVPHHHCNVSRWLLPEERVERPRTVGYLGEPGHLHDHAEIEAAVKKLGMRLVSASACDLEAYRQFDIGIAWTRRDRQRDETRSNIKLTNFAAHGIPSVVCDYESYRDADEALGGVCLIRPDLPGFLEALAELAGDAEMRRRFASRGATALKLYSRESVAEQYWQVIREARCDAGLE